MDEEELIYPWTVDPTYDRMKPIDYNSAVKEQADMEVYKEYPCIRNPNSLIEGRDGQTYTLRALLYRP